MSYNQNMDDGQPLINITPKRQDSSEDDVWETTIRPVMAEFIGVIVFVFVGTMVVQTGDIVSIGLAHGFSSCEYVQRRNNSHND
jgi:hypothetical protein